MEAIAGLVGVVVGAFLGFFAETFHRRLEDQQRLKYLTVHVSCTLETFAMRCADVADDDGSCDGQLADDECHRSNANIPKLDLEAISGRWEVLSPELLNQILSLPIKIEASKRQISGIFEHIADPPDYAEGF